MTNSLLAWYQQVRAHSLQRAAPLSPEDCMPQSMPDASPVKWHLAHTTWFFETFVLAHSDACQNQAFKPHHPAYRALFNSYYDGVGARHPRAQRGLVTRPDLAQVLQYRSAVDAQMEMLLTRHGRDMSLALDDLMTLGLHHEQQHQELMLTDVLHLFSLNPLFPAYDSQPVVPYPPASALQWQDCPQGVVNIGHSVTTHIGWTGTACFAFDNELPRHPTYISPCQIATRLSTQGEFADFIADGGYQRPELWLAEGWDWRRNNAIDTPLYWRASPTSHGSSATDWYTFGLHGLQPLDVHAPVCHLSYFEADAFARWSQARLPTEAEWEAVVQVAPDVQAALRPDHPQQWHGHVWQWTQSGYAPYPGFQVAAGAVGEYNGKFMVNQYVLRGSSSATPAGHARHTYRNFFPATARWQFAGVRLARDTR